MELNTLKDLLERFSERPESALRLDCMPLLIDTMPDSELFASYCTNLINSLTSEVFDEFITLNSDKERLQQLYPYALQQDIKISDVEKDYEVAQMCRDDGNKRYQIKDFYTAIESYTDGLVNCPIDTKEARELFSILLANRGAAFLESKNYVEALADIDDVLAYKTYPERLMYKIWLRKARCYKGLNKPFRKVKGCYVIAREKLGLVEISYAEYNHMMERIEAGIRDARVERVAIAPSDQDPAMSKIREFEKNDIYPALSKKVSVYINEKRGRFIKALENIKAGEAVAIEMPHCAVVASNLAMKYCEFCRMKCKRVIPCDDCTLVAFCSLTCKERAARFHKYECKINGTMRRYGVSINCQLAFRCVTQTALPVFLRKTSFPRLVATANKPYLYQDYDTINGLCNHIDRRPNAELLHYAFMAIFLLRLLKRTDYFHCKTSDKIITPQEAVIGGLILSHLQAFQFNAHEISTLMTVHPDDAEEYLAAEGNKGLFFTESVGAGVYPTLALFNHSCEPSVIRYNEGNCMILRAIRPIAKGEEVFDNYGPLYTSHSREDRLRVLDERYWFKCDCVACTNNWSTYAELDQNIVTFSCKSCSTAYSVSKDTETADFICANPRCNAPNNILLNLFNLLAVTPTCDIADQLYIQKKYASALFQYAIALKLHYKNLVPPCADMIRVQQKMRDCILHLGNQEEFKLIEIPPMY